MHTFLVPVGISYAFGGVFIIISPELALDGDQKWYLLLSHVNQILMLITMQLRQVTTRYFGDPSIPVEQLRTLLRCHLATVDSLFHHPTLGRESSRETLRELIQSLLQLLLDERTCELPDGENVIRAINSLCVRIIDSANGTLNTYSLDVILLDCHHFLKAFPSPSWKQRKSDVPLRTIKTMLHVLCRLQGSSILDFLENIPNKDDSELESYLLRTLKTIGGAAVASAPNSRRPSGSESRSKFGLPSAATREKLAEIFKKVASKQPEEAKNDRSTTSTSDEPEPRPTISANELLEIKMRLERIKSGQPL
ncbi:unnamed protein product [Echinostoma caproni]|uniref:PXA domain-containing protein n=1 Tax=Echinostoma caproni TaxID=27848 RepID=A0A183ATZ9_9TREM|nr:unnamed protein product [Echinostoma caproni]